MPGDHAALGDFLRLRRDRLTPAQVGLPAGPGLRRVAGLRREEVAVLAGVSADYLRRVEQGRQPAVSAGVLDALARALRLDEVERAHLHDLAAPGPPPPSEPYRRQRPEPGLLRLMGALEHVPVVLLGHRAEVLASNALLRAALGRDFAPGTSFLRFLFQDPLARERIANWRHFAAMAVAGMRREAARHPHDRVGVELIAELRATNPDVAAWWEDGSVRDHASMRKVLHHPVAGELTFDVEPVVSPWDLEQQLLIYTVEPGSATERALVLLASWSEAPAAP